MAITTKAGRELMEKLAQAAAEEEAAALQGLPDGTGMGLYLLLPCATKGVRLVPLTDEQYRTGELPKGYEALAQFYSGKESIASLTASPGTVYAIPRNHEGTSIYPRRAKALGRWKDEVQCMAWQLQAKGIERQALAEKAHKKHEDDVELNRNLGALRAAYQRSRGMHRSQLLAYIVEQVTK